MLARAAGGTASPWLMITTIVMVAVLFGAGHLPIAAQLGTLTVGVVARVIIYNALLGVAFGWLYWRRGLEHAMLAHFCADIVLHVVAPALTR
jgi:membrane protease YdiL (CAAX protease family)